MDAKVYEWVRRAREMIFDYCESLPAGLYGATVPGFGNESIRSLHVHAAECYLDWLGRFAMGEPVPEAEGPGVAATRRLFAAADATVGRFWSRFAASPDEPLAGEVSWQPEPIVVTPRWLLAHAITHEFHHKGQIVKLGRLLGHPAGPDTDLLLPAEEGDAGRLARLTGQAPAQAVAGAVAAALARALAPDVDAAALDRRAAGEAVRRGPVWIAATAQRELAAYPERMHAPVERALAAVAADPATGHAAGERQRYGFTALGADWRLVYTRGSDGRPLVLAVTTRDRAGR